MYKSLPHIGEIVTKAIAQKGFSKTDVADAIGMSRTNLYRQLDRADMKIGHVLKVGEFIGVNFLELIPALRKEMIDSPDISMVNEQQEDYEKVELEPLEMTVRLDGSERTLNQWIQRLRALNEVIAQENQ